MSNKMTNNFIVVVPPAVLLLSLFLSTVVISVSKFEKNSLFKEKEW